MRRQQRSWKLPSLRLLSPAITPALVGVLRAGIPPLVTLGCLACRERIWEVVDFIVAQSAQNPNAAYAGSVPYLMLCGNLMAGWQMGRALLVALTPEAQAQDAAFMAAKVTTARFYADHILSKVPGMRDSIVEGADSVTALALDAF